MKINWLRCSDAALPDTWTQLRASKSHFWCHSYSHPDIPIENSNFHCASSSPVPLQRWEWHSYNCWSVTNDNESWNRRQLSAGNVPPLLLCFFTSFLSFQDASSYSPLWTSSFISFICKIAHYTNASMILIVVAPSLSMEIEDIPSLGGVEYLKNSFIDWRPGSLFNKLSVPLLLDDG